MIIVNGWKPLTIITKSSTLDVAAVLDPPLKCGLIWQVAFKLEYSGTSLKRTLTGQKFLSALERCSPWRGLNWKVPKFKVRLFYTGPTPTRTTLPLFDYGNVEWWKWNLKTKVTSKRINRGGGYGLEVPCKYRISEQEKAVDWIKRKATTFLQENLLAVHKCLGKKYK